VAGDRIAEYVINLGGDDRDLRAIFSAFKSRVRSDVAELEAITGKVELFKGTEARAQAAADAFFKARDAAAVYRQEIARIEAQGGKVGDDLLKSLQATERAATSASREYNRQSDALVKLGASLKRAGVDTTNLAAEQQRLAAASKAAAAAATEQDARQVLGLKTLKDISPEIARLNAAYNTLRASGTLSFKELALAQQQLQTRTAELRGQLTGVGSAIKGVDLAGFFQRSILPALGLAGGITSVVLALKSAVDQARQFQQGVAEIGTVTNASKAELAELGAGARLLAQQLGVDVNEALKGVFDLLRSGVPRDNVLEVLRVAAEAGKASLTDLGTSVRVANLLLDAFGADIADLPALFDKLIRGAHDGGATLKEFADGGGALLNVARAAGVSFDELIAVLTVLVNKSGNAEKSVADLTKIIAKLDTADARNKLRDLGITGDSLVDIFGQIGARGLSLGEVLGLNLTGAGVKSAASLATLTSNAKALPEELERITNSAGETAKSLATMLDTPKERSARFSAELDAAAISIGRLVGSGSGLQKLGTNILHEFNQIPAAFEAVSNASKDTGGSWKAMLGAFVQTDPIAANAARALKAQAEAAKAAGDNTSQAAAQAKKANQDLADFSAKLLADIQAIQAASARNIADVTARADAQIAALDRSKAAEAATAAATLDIQLKLAADRLAIIKDAESKITAALNAEIPARERAARAAGDNEKKIAADSASARIAALAPVLAQYQAHYAALITVAQAASAKFQAAEQARVDIAKSVAAALRQIALEGLSGLDQFLEKQKEVDRLISEGRRAAIQGDIAASKQFFEQAIAESNTLTKVINDDGVVIVTALQARTTKLDLLKKISDAANESIGDQGEAAKKGADAAVAEAERVGVKIKELQGQYDELKRVAAEGLTMKVETDQASVQAALATLNELTKPRTVTVTVVTVGGGASGSPEFVGPPAPPGLARGGFVRKFAGGGAVFRNPNWSKVPGRGSQDTVPALLQAGSFVVKRSASQLYGDSIMGALARFAIGGIAQRILSPQSELLQRLFGSEEGGGDLVAASGPYAETLAQLQDLKEKTLGIPRTTPPFIGLGDWAGQIIQAFQLFSEPHRQTIKELLDSSYLGWLDGIEQARRFHVPITMDGTLMSLMQVYARGGGAGSDAVPALLTPGEWVIPKPAVQRLGSRFLEALNNTRIAPSFFANFAAFPPVPRFAMGGPVPGANIPSRPSGRGEASRALAAITVNVYGAPSDFKDQSAIRRLFLPTLREIERRSKDK
jgi:TP901 family phage tail tape measure protein